MSQNLFPPVHLPESQYRPRYQQYWFVDEAGNWQATTAAQISNAATSPVYPTKIRLISWNIDFMAQYANERMTAAMQYLDQLTTSIPSDTPIVVFLQEMTSADLTQIRQATWIQQRFNITDSSTEHWRGSGYGTTTLVDRRVQIQNVFRVPFLTGMHRDGLFVDLALENTEGAGTRVPRLCNCHLESLVADPPVRPVQLAVAAKYLNDKDEVASALLAGDLNAIQPFDRTLHLANDLKDAYLELGGQEDTDGGYTWGQQAQRELRELFGCCRMDKILFSGKLQPKTFERIGVGVKVKDENLDEVAEEVEDGFVTDHYGVMGDFELTDGWKLAGCGDDDWKVVASSHI